MTEQDTAKPWYREFWAWFILAPLISSVILSSIMVTTAIKHGDDQVTVDYYKKGRMINQDLAQVEVARAKAISADIRFDLELGDLTLTLASQDQAYVLPEQLTLFMEHPIDENFDRVIVLREFAPGNYRADLESKPNYRWYLRLLPGDASQPIDIDQRSKIVDPNAWRLNGEIDFQQTEGVLLNAL